MAANSLRGLSEYPAPGRVAPSAIKLQVAVFHERGLIEASHLNAAGFVTSVALSLTEQLSREEARINHSFPADDDLGARIRVEERTAAIVNQFVAVAVVEVAGMAV